MKPDLNTRKKIRVLHLTFRSDLSGGPKHLLFLLQQIKTNSEPVDSYVGSPNGACYEEFRKYANGILPLWTPYLYFFNLIRIVFFCHQNAIDIIHSHGRGAGLYSRIVKPFCSCKVVHTLHGIYVEKSVKSRLKIFLDRTLLPLTDCFICVSVDEYEKAKELRLTQSRKTDIVVNAVDYPSIDKAYNKCDQNSQSVRGPIQIGLVGQLIHRKGWDLLLNAIEKNLKNLIEGKVTFFIAGKGDLRAHLERTLHQRNLTDVVKFCGEVTDIIKFLADKHILVSFSRSEGLPISVLEAMSCRLPCLLSDVVGHRSFTNENGENCVLLFNPENPTEFYKKLKVLYDSKQRKKYGELSRKLIEQNHDPNRWASKTVSIYRKLM